jgi:hypothetical protein
VKFLDDQGDRARSSPPADWDKLLESDAQVSDIVGVPGLVTWRPYTTTTSTSVWWRSPTRVRHGVRGRYRAGHGWRPPRGERQQVPCGEADLGSTLVRDYLVRWDVSSVAFH